MDCSAAVATSVAGSGSGSRVGEVVVGAKTMEGWLYLFRANRFGLHQRSKRRYFVLQHDNCLNCYKTATAATSSTARKLCPIRSARIDSYIRVSDNGRETINSKVFFLFTVYSTSNHNDQLKLGAKSSEEAAKWRRSIMEAALKVFPPREENDLICIRSRWTSFSFSWRNSRSQKYSVDWSRSSSMCVDRMTCDVIEANPWEIFGYKQGLRLFKEANDVNVQREHRDDHPAIMAVGVVDATPEEIFEMVMSFGPSRSEWDFCFANGNVVEHLDGHTDIIHMELRGDWLPWGMKPRDLLLKRYWREDDGTYVILYHSVYHPNCLSDRRFIRACLKSGGYVISPINQGRQSVVKHMLAIDWKSWKSYLFTSTTEHITIRMLERVASLREMFQAKGRKFLSCDFSLGEVKRDMNCQRIEEMKLEVQLQEDSTNTECIEASQMSQENSENMCGSVLEMNDAAEEFFDFLDESEYEQKDNMQASDSELKCQDLCISKQSTAAVIMKKLQDLAVQTKGYIGLEDDLMREDTALFSYGCTLQEDSTCTLMSSCTMADPSTFLIRSKTYLRDHRKIMASGTLMEMVGADWLKSHIREDDLGSRHGGIVQKYASKCGGEFFFIINIQVPGSTTYSLALYYMMRAPVESVPLLDRFTKSDDAYRNSRFKLIPHISKGPWIVKQSVGKKACLVGRALEMNCFQGTNYLELGIDIGSSTVARGVVGLVLGYLSNLVIEMAFLIQGNTEEELPEFLIGTCRLNHLDVSKAVPIGLD